MFALHILIFLDDFYITPISCYASKLQPLQSDTPYKLWEYQTNPEKCFSNDVEIIPDDTAWKATPDPTKNKGTLTIGFKAFRFIDSETVIITCSAHLCKESAVDTCKKTCAATTVETQNNIGKRRRRSERLLRNGTANAYSKQASVSLRVAFEEESSSTVCISARKGIIFLSCIMSFLMTYKS